MERQCRKHTHADGFSLIELMIVVVIVGILSAIAIPTFSGYVSKSRAAEATQFLGVIKLRQEAYRAEFGLYACTYTGCFADSDPGFSGPSNFWPRAADAVTAEQVFFGGNASWNQLGAKPDGYVRFAYATRAGAPGDAPGVPGTWSGDHWFVSQAVGDLDGDGDRCTFETYSESKQVWYTPDKGWE